MSFYVHLPSNGSQASYPGNTLSDFKIKLPYTLDFIPSEYEVGLVEFSYNASIQALTKTLTDNVITVEKTATGDVREFVIPIKNYDNVHVLIDEINELFESSFLGLLKFHYFEVKNRVRIEFNKKLEHNILKISKNLSIMLGFDGETTFKGDIDDSISIATNAPNLVHGFEHIFIYTDIIQPQVVGTSMVPLLRRLSFERSPISVTKIFMKPFYFPLSKCTIDTIGVVICNEYGDKLKFDKGPVTLTLHFRRISSIN